MRGGCGGAAGGVGVTSTVSLPITSEGPSESGADVGGSR